MTVTPRYRNTTESPIISYNWIDFVQRVGYIQFFFALTKEGASYDYILTTGTPHSDMINGMAASDGVSAGATTNTYTFETTTLNTPILLEGDAYIELSKDVYLGTGTISLSGAILKDDGTTTTELIQFTGGNKTDVPDAEAWLAKATIPKSLIKIGEKIKVVLNFTASQSSGSQYTVYIGTDPANRAYGNMEFSNSSIFLPVRIDI